MGSIFPYTEGEKRHFNTGAEWSRALIYGKKTHLHWKAYIYLGSSTWVKSPSSEAAAVYISAQTAWDVMENQFIATAHCNLQFHFNGRKLCLLLRNVWNGEKEFCAAVCLPILLWEESKWRGNSTATCYSEAAGRRCSPRWWPVHKASALTAYRATSTSTVAGNAFRAVEVGSKGKGSACAKLGSFFMLCEALVSRCTQLGKDTITPINPRDWLPPVYVYETKQVQVDIHGWYLSWGL